MRIAIDPGTLKSGVIYYEMPGELPLVIASKELDNDAVLIALAEASYDAVSIEMIAKYEMAGQTTFDTCFWIGRFFQQASLKGVVPDLVFRRDVWYSLCGRGRGNDMVVRAGVYELYGGKEKACGKKQNPGPLFGVTGHAMQALAVAITRENAGNFKR